MFPINGIMRYVDFRAWLLLLSVLFLRSVHVKSLLSVFRAYCDNDTPLCGEARFCLSIRELVVPWVVSAFSPSWIMLLWNFMCELLCRYMFWVFLDIYSESYGNCLAFWETVKMFSKAAEPFYIFTAIHGNSSFSKALPTLVIFWFFK